MVAADLELVAQGEPVTNRVETQEVVGVEVEVVVERHGLVVVDVHGVHRVIHDGTGVHVVVVFLERVVDGGVPVQVQHPGHGGENGRVGELAQGYVRRLWILEHRVVRLVKLAPQRDPAVGWWKILLLGTQVVVHEFLQVGVVAEVGMDQLVELAGVRILLHKLQRRHHQVQVARRDLHAFLHQRAHGTEDDLVLLPHLDLTHAEVASIVEVLHLVEASDLWFSWLEETGVETVGEKAWRRFHEHQERLRNQMASVNSACSSHGKSERMNALPGVFVDLTNGECLFKVSWVGPIAQSGDLGRHCMQKLIKCGGERPVCVSNCCLVASLQDKEVW